MKIISKLYICDLDLKKFYDMPIGELFMIKKISVIRQFKEKFLLHAKIVHFIILMMMNVFT